MALAFHVLRFSLDLYQAIFIIILSLRTRCLWLLPGLFIFFDHFCFTKDYIIGFSGTWSTLLEFKPHHMIFSLSDPLLAFLFCLWNWLLAYFRLLLFYFLSWLGMEIRLHKICMQVWILVKVKSWHVFIVTAWPRSSSTGLTMILIWLDLRVVCIVRKVVHRRFEHVLLIRLAFAFTFVCVLAFSDFFVRQGLLVDCVSEFKIWKFRMSLAKFDWERKVGVLVHIV